MGMLKTRTGLAAGLLLRPVDWLLLLVARQLLLLVGLRLLRLVSLRLLRFGLVAGKLGLRLWGYWVGLLMQCLFLAMSRWGTK